MEKIVKEKDLCRTDVCGQCGKNYTSHLAFVPPMAVLKTGWCEHCQNTKIGLESIEGDDVSVSARYLADFFGEMASINSVLR